MQTVLSFLDSGFSGWIGAVASIVAVILSIIIYFLTRKKKALSYEILAEDPLISIADEIKRNLQVLYGGSPVENVHLLLVKFINSGNVPITSSDFERPITLKLKDRSKVLSAERVKASPDNLFVSLKIEDKVITVEPALMNGGDFFTAKVLIGQYSGSFDVDARIVGVKSIRVLRRQSQTESVRRNWKFTSIRKVATIFLVASIISLLVVLNNESSKTPSQTLPQTPSQAISPTPESTPQEITNSNSTRIFIPAIGRATPYPSNITVSGVRGTIQKLTVEIPDLNHAFMGDLNVLLLGPNQQAVILMADVGGSSKLRHVNIVFDDEAATSMSSNASGRYRPTNYKRNYRFPNVSFVGMRDALSTFKGISPNGTWSLYVIDDSNGDSGSFNAGWKLIMKVD